LEQAIAIHLDNVRKQYCTKLAVDGISLQVSKGEIFGIVGPNGAGKTTLIEMMEGLRPADGGHITVLGQDIRKQREQIQQRIGVLFQSTSIPGKTKVREVLSLFASFYDRKANVDEIIRFLGLQDKLHAMYKSLSGGWKQRVSLALALINDPDIIFLDEPSMGLDPNARSDMWDMILHLRQEGRTIIVTTHYMEEAEALCDRVAMIHSGKLIAMDTPQNLISQLGRTQRVTFKKVEQCNPASLEALPHVVNIESTPTSVVLHTGNADETVQYLYQLAAEEQWKIQELKIESATMSDVFIELTVQGG
jgi:ABC-2 type transport system ATP-binding protein